MLWSLFRKFNGGNRGSVTGVRKGIQSKLNFNKKSSSGGGNDVRQNKLTGKQGKTTLRGRINKTSMKPLAGKLVDARNKLVAKNRIKIADARDRLADLSKKSDLRQKLLSKKPEVALKLASLKSKPVHKLRDVEKNTITRTIISRTINNDMARHSYGGALHYTPQYEIPLPTHFYKYQNPDPNYDFV